MIGSLEPIGVYIGTGVKDDRVCRAYWPISWHWVKGGRVCRAYWPIYWH